MEWLAAIEELELLNGLLGRSEGPEFGLALEQRGRVIERIAALDIGPVPPAPDVLAQLSQALAGVVKLRRQLALRREQIRVELEGLNRAGILLHRLQDPGRSASRIDCCG